MSAKRISANVAADVAAATKSDEWKLDLLRAYDTPGNPLVGSRITREELDFLAELKRQGPRWKLSESEPLLVPPRIAKQLFSIPQLYQSIFIYQNSAYSISEPYSDEEMRLLVLDAADSDRVKFERLKAKFDPGASKETSGIRTPIPEDVRIAVWRRDQGKCVRCGSRENLEYDHVIPLSQGGSNTVRNIELLCEKCNRSKGSKIQ